MMFSIKKFQDHWPYVLQFRYLFILGDPCYNGEQNGYETGVDCGGPDCKKCIDETDRSIPWLLWASTNN